MRRGFTLIEMLVVVGITAVIAIAVASAGRFVFQQNRFLQSGLAEDQAARQAMRGLAKELRAAATADSGAYPIVQAGTSSISFFSDIDSDGAHEQIRYFLSGHDFRRGVIEPSGVPVVYDPATEATSTLVTDLSVPSGGVFTYYDKNYAGTSTPLSLPIQVSAIRLVRLVLSDYTTQVSIRSLKDNL